jgi:hypothetical protein
MANKMIYRVILFAAVVNACSCTAVNIVKYYDTHQPILDSIQRSFKTAYRQRPFSIEFTDRPFTRVSLELMTDSLKYIYEFDVGERRMEDTLIKFGFSPPVISTLIRQMRSGQCTWVNQLDYYVDQHRQSLTYISLWPRVLNFPFVNKKYYILAYFAQPQYFDSRGNLLTGKRRRRIRKINTEVFKRINDQVCYTLSDRFR